MASTIDFQDWELLHSASDSDSAHSVNNIHSAAFIHLNYFSSDTRNPFQEDIPDDHTCIDHGSENNPTLVDSFDSTSDRPDDRKFSQTEEIREIIFSQDQKKKVQMLEEEDEDLGKLYLDSSRVDIISPEHGVVAGEVDSHDEPEVPRAENNEIESIGCGGEVIEDGGSKENSQLKKRSVMWWKMPVQFLKYCVFRMTPLCAISIAAAAMLGFAILGRRLYKMKKKTKGPEIKVTVDDKKISQVMSRVARLNEAFLIVKRVPAIRPSLGGVGSINSWPAMTLR